MAKMCNYNVGVILHDWKIGTYFYYQVVQKSLSKYAPDAKGATFLHNEIFALICPSW